MDESTKDPDNPDVIAPPPLIYLGAIAAGAITDSFIAWRFALFAGQSFLGGVTVALGLLLSAWSVLEFVKHGTHPDPRHPTTALIATGPFRLTRNPIYVAFALMHLGTAIWTTMTWMLIALAPALLLVHFGVVRREERYLSRKFPEAYGRYRSTVRRWL